MCLRRLHTIIGCDYAVRMMGHVCGYPQVERLAYVARVSWWWSSEECDAAVVGNCAHLQSRGHVIFQGGCLGILDCVPDYWCNVGGDYLDRYVCSYLGGRGGITLAPALHASPPCFKYGSIRIACSKLEVKE